MPSITVRLFGKFCVSYQEQVLEGLAVCKVQELFCYLLLHRDRPHPRETLAALLWGDAPTVQSKKNLRQTLWQLQTALDVPQTQTTGQVLAVEAEWVQIGATADLWLDVDVVEQAYAGTQGVPGEQFDPAIAATVQHAVALYGGDLLEGQYQDWCLYERERLQHMYLALLEKLMGYYTAGQAYEKALAQGQRILQYDCAHERTHRQLMHLYYLAGDRAAALRQYTRCCTALTEELGVTPGRSTRALYEQVRADQLDIPSVPPPAGSTAPAHLLPAMLGRLQQVQAKLIDLQQQVQQDIQALEQALNQQR